MATGGYDYTSSNEFYRAQDRLDLRASMSYALDSYALIKRVGLRVILIEEIDKVRYGVMDGVVMQSDDEFVLIIKDLSDESIHRFVTPSNFDWYQTKYFMKSSWWRRRKYITAVSLELRDRTYQLFDAALAKGIYKPDEVDHYRDSDDWTLRWNLRTRIGMPMNSSWSELMDRIKGM